MIMTRSSRNGYPNSPSDLRTSYHIRANSLSAVSKMVKQKSAKKKLYHIRTKLGGGFWVEKKIENYQKRKTQIVHVIFSVLDGEDGMDYYI